MGLSTSGVSPTKWIPLSISRLEMTKPPCWKLCGQADSLLWRIGFHPSSRSIEGTISLTLNARRSPWRHAANDTSHNGQTEIASPTSVKTNYQSECIGSPVGATRQIRIVPIMKTEFESESWSVDSADIGWWRLD